jgi:folate-binding protein YgfZ
MISSLNSGVAPVGGWLEELRSAGATFDAGRVLHFGDAEAERVALAGSPTLHPLVEWSILRATGTDAAAFLQGQLSNDVDMLDASHAQLSTYCTAQGRMLAIVLLWREAADYLLRLPAEIAAETRARLQKYILRAAVVLADATPQLRLLGLGGPGASAALAELVDVPPDAPMAIARGREVTVIRLDGEELFEIVVPARHWTAVWNRLARRVRPGGTEGWRWRLIRAGIPVISATTQEQFVPQMANLEELGAVSFTKGCYPGQEIVARAQYRGEVKRRLFRLHAPKGAPAAGQPVFQSGKGTACGTVLDAAPAPGAGVDLLAVVSVDAARAGDLRLGAGDGHELRVCR